MEAELVSLDTTIRCLGIPLFDLMETLVTNGHVKMVVYEDNQATAKIVKSGKFRAMAHVTRVHGVSLSFIHEQYRKGLFALEDCHTGVMAADIFTKFFIDALKWGNAILLIGIIDGKNLANYGGDSVQAPNYKIRSNTPSIPASRGADAGSDVGPSVSSLAKISLDSNKKKKRKISANLRQL